MLNSLIPSLTVMLLQKLGGMYLLIINGIIFREMYSNAF